MPGVDPTPLGVYDFKPPREASFIAAKSVGGSFAAKAAAGATKAANDVNRLLPNWGDLVDAIL